MTPLWTTIGTLAVFRVTHLLHAEDGPWDLVLRLRRRAGSGFFGSLLDCFYCLSLWIAAPVALSLAETWPERLLLWPALSAGAIVVERLTHRERAPAAAPYHEDEVDHELLWTRSRGAPGEAGTDDDGALRRGDGERAAPRDSARIGGEDGNDRGGDGDGATLSLRSAGRAGRDRSPRSPGGGGRAEPAPGAVGGSGVILPYAAGERGPSRIMVTPPFGPQVGPRGLGGTGASLARRKRRVERRVARTIFISWSAKAAPMQRRAPPPKGRIS
jgi:hypothetical protein